jgi:hypothetical protein
MRHRYQMDNKEMKKAFEGLLQYGWMWGNPRHINRKDWELFHKFYKEELNDGVEFKPDTTKKAQAT